MNVVSDTPTVCAADLGASNLPGGKKEMEQVAATPLPPATNPKLGGFTFKLPSRAGGLVLSSAPTMSKTDTRILPLSEDFLCSPDRSHTHKSTTTASSTAPPKTAKSYKSSADKSDQYFISKKNRKDRRSFRGRLDSVSGCWICPPRSLQRVCCEACRAKRQQACNCLLRRDRNVQRKKRVEVTFKKYIYNIAGIVYIPVSLTFFQCKVTLSMNSWKIPGVHPTFWAKTDSSSRAKLAWKDSLWRSLRLSSS